MFDTFNVTSFSENMIEAAEKLVCHSLESNNTNKAIDVFNNLLQWHQEILWDHDFVETALHTLEYLFKNQQINDAIKIKNQFLSWQYELFSSKVFIKKAKSIFITLLQNKEVDFAIMLKNNFLKHSPELVKKSVKHLIRWNKWKYNKDYLSKLEKVFILWL